MLLLPFWPTIQVVTTSLKPSMYSSEHTGFLTKLGLNARNDEWRIPASSMFFVSTRQNVAGSNFHTTQSCSKVKLWVMIFAAWTTIHWRHQSHFYSHKLCLNLSGGAKRHTRLINPAPFNVISISELFLFMPSSLSWQCHLWPNVTAMLNYILMAN